MFDRTLLAITKPVADRIASMAFQRGITANQISLAGFACGVIAAALIAAGHSHIAIVPLAINRLADGLDGAVARLSRPTDRGAYLDITLDFLFYAAVPLAFAISNPAENALAGAVLLASFIGTGTSFLAFAIMAEKRGEKSTAYPSKSFYYLGGLTEGFETIACFVLMCLWPSHFTLLAYVFSIMCCMTTATRLAAGWERFGKPPG